MQQRQRINGEQGRLQAPRHGSALEQVQPAHLLAACCALAPAVRGQVECHAHALLPRRQPFLQAWRGGAKLVMLAG